MLTSMLERRSPSLVLIGSIRREVLPSRTIIEIFLLSSLFSLISWLLLFISSSKETISFSVCVTWFSISEILAFISLISFSFVTSLLFCSSNSFVNFSAYASNWLIVLALVSIGSANIETTIRQLVKIIVNFFIIFSNIFLRQRHYQPYQLRFQLLQQFLL